MAKLFKKTTRILPTPRAIRLRTRTPAASPRHSRRIAGFEPDAPCGGTSVRTKKKVMRALNIIGETSGIDQHSLDEYNRLFTQSSAPGSLHVQAMAALFG